jgi:hypothetical protein
VTGSGCSVREALATENAGNLGLTIASTSLVARHDGVDRLDVAITPGLQRQSFSAGSFSLPKAIRSAVFDALRYLGVIA